MTADDIDRLIALWDSPDYDDGGPLPADQQADDDSATWCVWEGGPFAHHARTSARRRDRHVTSTDTRPVDENRPEMRQR